MLGSSFQVVPGQTRRTILSKMTLEDALSRKENRVLLSTMGVALYFLAIITLAYAGESIEITLRNFLDVRPFNGNYEYSDIKEVGIPVGKHILIVRSCHCLDNATDKKGNHYYFYMVDRPNRLKALITATELNPVGELDEKTREFYELVKQEIKRDGGIEALIEKFRKSTQGATQQI